MKAQIQLSASDVLDAVKRQLSEYGVGEELQKLIGELEFQVSYDGRHWMALADEGQDTNAKIRIASKGDRL